MGRPRHDRVWQEGDQQRARRQRAEDTQQVLDWTIDFFGAAGDLAYVNYEMIKPDDQFGRMMVQNLEDRGCQAFRNEGFGFVFFRHVAKEIEAIEVHEF